MKITPRILTGGVVLFLGLSFLNSFRTPALKGSIDVVRFAQIPVLNGGRIKPLDTIARTSLLSLSGKQTLRRDRRKVPAIRWLMDVLYNPGKTARENVFEINDPDVLGFLNLKQAHRRVYSFNDLKIFLARIARQASHAQQIEAPHRSRFQTAILLLQSRLILYQKLQNTLQIAGARDLSEKLQKLNTNLSAIMAEHAKLGGHSAGAFQEVSELFQQYRWLSRVAAFNPLPLPGADKDPGRWINIGSGVSGYLESGLIHPGVLTLAKMADAYRENNPQLFNSALNEHFRYLKRQIPRDVRLANKEFLFNLFDPFTKSMILYVMVLILVFISWLKWEKTLSLLSYAILIFSFLVHTGGLLARILLQGRPPVTNLYSSAIFVGWGAVLMGIILERIYKRGIGSVAASAIGLTTLIIAHHLAAQGDTMEMMRAVLDSNFWLSTHVLTITIGYSSTFISGFIAAYYLFRRLYPKKPMTKKASDSLLQMVYGVVCFSTLLSFIGTILGGIWADQSWGRFWGWDPKENGALMIVLWNVFILHARWRHFAGTKATMMMAVFGNVITALSWFGVNMLGIGLHSYGFMDKAFFWLMAFVISQFVIIGLGWIPARSPSSKSP